MGYGDVVLWNQRLDVSSTVVHGSSEGMLKMVELIAALAVSSKLSGTIG